ncbi:AAA family ATPase [Micromonospora sp. CA-259024]|uniref:helix-turn-helix transcriptional regulator n=1 Tax=Micromonospora sp. CA-259024 TaxID=3239965 RepID=UPI003D92472C
MNFVEREQELAELSEVLVAGAAGRGNAVVVGGGIGCGKTELIDAVKERAAATGFLVLGAVGCWAERASDAGVLGQLLHYAEDPLRPARIRELLTELGRGVPAEADPDGGRRTLSPATTDALHQLCAEVLQASEKTPILLCVDDVQFVDTLSQHWLIQLLGRIRSARVVVLLAESTLSRSASPQLRAALLRLPTYRRITLNLLSSRGVEQLLAAHLGAAAARALAPECEQITAGNPLLVRALIEDHRDAAPDTVRLTVGDAYGDAVVSCALRGRPVLLRLAQILAVLDDEGDAADLLDRLLDAEESATVQRGLHALQVAGLLQGARFRHPVARAAVLASLPPQRRAALHRRAAELLDGSAAPATRVARYLIATDQAPPAWALGVLRSAAEQHLVDNRAAEAYACADAALRLCTDETDQMHLRVLLAGAAWLLNPSITARHLGELAVALRDGRLPAQHAVLLAKCLLWYGRYEEAADAIDRVVTRADGAEPVTAAENRATLEVLSSSYPSLVPGRKPGRPGPGAARDPRVRSAAALSHVLAHGADDAAVAEAEAAMRAMRLGKRTQEALLCGVAALQFADRLPTAAGWCDHWLEQARARRVPLWEAEFASLRAGIALRQGNPVLARQLAENALKLVPADSWGVCIGGPLTHLVQAAVETGDHAAASAYLDIPVHPGMFRSRFGLHYTHARGWHHLAEGRPLAALDDFTACGTMMAEWGFDRPELVPWRSEAARAHLALGDVPKARALAQEQLALVRPGPSRTRGLSLRVLAAAAPVRERAVLLTDAIEVLRACGDRLQLAGALADLGRFYHRAGRPARARPVIEAAARLARACGATPLLRGLPEAYTIAGRPAAGAERSAALQRLSRAERRVAELAARGYTNREIAKRLCVTVSTVEQHLTRTFRKLGVKARQDLPEEMVLDVMRG